MAFNPITVNKGPSANPHIYAEDDAAIFQSMFGEDGILDIGSKLELSIQSNNLVRMSDGALCVGGHIGRIKYADYVDLTIDNGETGHNRNDLIIGSFRNTGEHTIDTFEPQVVKGTPATGDAVDPTLTEGSLYEGEYLRQVAVARVKLEGLNIVGIDMLLPVIPSIPSLEEQLAELNRKLNVSVSDIVNFTPLAGQNYPNWGGCYYYKSGSRVHVHLGIQGLPANQVATVFVLPEAVHPKTRIFSVGSSGSFPGVARTEIALDGGINVTSQDTYAAADIEYDTY